MTTSVLYGSRATLPRTSALLALITLLSSVLFPLRTYARPSLTNRFAVLDERQERRHEDCLDTVNQRGMLFSKWSLGRGVLPVVQNEVEPWLRSEMTTISHLHYTGPAAVSPYRHPLAELSWRPITAAIFYGRDD